MRTRAAQIFFLYAACSVHAQHKGEIHCQLSGQSNCLQRRNLFVLFPFSVNHVLDIFVVATEFC